MLELHTKTERWPLKEPFRISGYVFTEAEIVCVTLTRKGRTGMGEAAGDLVDLDGPVFLAGDREPRVTYRNGMVSYGDTGWGNPEAAIRAKAS